jgi:hypothetical protein
MLGIPNRVLHWLLPLAYLLFLVVTVWMIARDSEYRPLLADVRFRILLVSLALVAVLIAQVDPWRLGVLTFWGIMACLTGILCLENQGKTTFVRHYTGHAPAENVEGDVP